jgi:hypothetical protein
MRDLRVINADPVEGYVVEEGKIAYIFFAMSW